MVKNPSQNRIKRQIRKSIFFSKSSPSKYRSAEREREREREREIEREREKERISEFQAPSLCVIHCVMREKERERENLGILELLSQAEFMRHTLIATFSGNQCMTRKLKAIIFQS